MTPRPVVLVVLAVVASSVGVASGCGDDDAGDGGVDLGRMDAGERPDAGLVPGLDMGVVPGLDMGVVPGLDMGVVPGLDMGVVPDAGSGRCGYEDRGVHVEVAPAIEVCLPPVVCTSETCPPPLGTCVAGSCVFRAGYAGIATLPEAWATYYCDLDTGGCHGVSQLRFPEETAARVGAAMGLPLCDGAPAGTERCVGIAASSPMVVGNSEVATDPATGTTVRPWGLGLTEASGLCYEVTGPGGSAVVALTDRCGGYCACGGSGYQECGPCVSAPDMSPNCACVGPVPGLFGDCCGVGCPTVEASCDWCASNNHPHFDLDVEAFNHVCGIDAARGSCRLAGVRFFPCLDPEPGWPPGGGGAACRAEEGVFDCGGVAPFPEQPVVPGTRCCCNWGLTPRPDGTCG